MEGVSAAGMEVLTSMLSTSQAMGEAQVKVLNSALDMAETTISALLEGLGENVDLKV